MTADPSSFLAGLRLGDSFLPSGTFTASYGLEEFVQRDRVTTAEELQALLEQYLHQRVGPAELVAVGNAHAAGRAGELEMVEAVDDRLDAATLAMESRESSRRSGRQLLELACDLEPSGVVSRYAERVEAGAPGSYPVVLALFAERSGLSAVQSCLVHGYGFLTGLLGAAQRLLRLGHTAVQRVLEALLEELLTVTERYADEPLEAVQSFAPLIDIHGMSHERADRRLFTS